MGTLWSISLDCMNIYGEKHGNYFVGGTGKGTGDKVKTGIKTHRRKQGKHVEGCKRKPRENGQDTGRRPASRTAQTKTKRHHNQKQCQVRKAGR